MALRSRSAYHAHASGGCRAVRENRREYLQPQTALHHSHKADMWPAIDLARTCNSTTEQRESTTRRHFCGCAQLQNSATRRSTRNRSHAGYFSSTGDISRVGRTGPMTRIPSLWRHSHRSTRRGHTAGRSRHVHCRLMTDQRRTPCTRSAFRRHTPVQRRAPPSRIRLRGRRLQRLACSVETWDREFGTNREHFKAIPGNAEMPMN